jgi:predicted ATP-dependent endonuclease of OLD family
MVGSGIFEVLNILAVVIGAKEKVILLDEPALHLHPKYQKKLLKVFKDLNKKDGNQIIIITHSPYLVDIELLNNTFRFYKDENGKTKNIRVGEVVKNLYGDKIQKKFEENETKKRLLFANGVLLTEGGCEYHSLPILLEKIGYSPEDYNIEIVNVRGKDGFKEYIELLNSLRIPFGIVCDGETAFNIYRHNRIKEEKAKKIIKKLNKILDEEGISEDEIKNKIKEIVEKYNTDYELKNENDYSTIINAFKEVFNNSEKHPFWLENSKYREIFDNIIKEMEELRKTLKNEGKERLPTNKEVESTCIEPLYDKFADILKEKLFIFVCKEYDWTGFLEIKKDKVEKCIKKAYELNEDDEKLKDLKNFIENFIDKRINPK